MLVIPGASRFAYSLNVTLATRRGTCSRRIGIAGYSPRGNPACGSLRWRLQICRVLKLLESCMQSPKQDRFKCYFCSSSFLLIRGPGGPGQRFFLDFVSSEVL